ncbi:D-aspartate oxidase isoform X2 [Argonauta hians]
MVKIAVVGAGVVGLSTALLIQKAYPNSQVTVIADKFNVETTSDGAGGLFRPNYATLKSNHMEDIKRWSQESFSHFSSMFNSSKAGDAGIVLMSGFLFSNADKESGMIEGTAFSETKLPREDIERMGYDYKNVTKVLTFTIECRKYMPWLSKQFAKLGGKIQYLKLKSFEELVGIYDIVVNCSGLGSKYLVPDPAVYAVKGQLIQAQAPWIKHFYYFDDDTYIIPNVDRVSLGGIRLKHDYSPDVDPEITKSIWDRCTSRVPSLKKAKVLWKWAGLRPHRDPIRVEIEHMTFPCGDLKVVHNYGHGANGVSLSWGTAVDAADLVKKLVEGSKYLVARL